MARTVGLYSRTGSAVAVVIDDVTLVSRWDLDLTEGRVPAQVCHVAADLPRPEAEQLLRRVVNVVTDTAQHRLRELLADVGAVDAVAVVVGDHPVPESLSAILASHTLMHAAEGQLYRDALLDAAAALGQRGIGLPRKLAQSQLDGDMADVIRRMGASAGPPWRKEHKLAAVAALTAAAA
jgi:hypothetical protein